MISQIKIFKQTETHVVLFYRASILDVVALLSLPDPIQLLTHKKKLHAGPAVWHCRITAGIAPAAWQPSGRVRGCSVPGARQSVQACLEIDVERRRITAIKAAVL